MNQLRFPIRMIFRPRVPVFPPLGSGVPAMVHPAAATVRMLTVGHCGGQGRAVILVPRLRRAVELTADHRKLVQAPCGLRGPRWPVSTVRWRFRDEWPGLRTIVSPRNPSPYDAQTRLWLRNGGQ